MDYTTEINIITQEQKQINFTAKEIKQRESDLVAISAIRAEAEANATAKSALLTRLGITADEARLLL